MGLKIGLPGILAQSDAAEVGCLKKCIEKKNSRRERGFFGI
jgi:hypothetical protein